ncbi:MAG: hypothetical protein QE285_21000 [Aquabacterium sp.]|nr:hypothetical protein [Aquabacterium sp.]
MTWRRALFDLAPLAAAVLLASAVQAQVDHALYLTGEGATARLRGDATALPAAATRCANCHEASRQPGAADAAYAPRLDARLAQALPRRGGPPSAYDASNLCTLLRTGLDPARVLVRRAMPVYEIDDAGCATLWRALSLREPLTEKP